MASAPPRMDRRVARTRDALHQALLALTLEQGYEGVTVREICRRANVGRSTFYANFADKNALKRSGLATIRDELTGGDAATGGFRFSLPMLEHGRSHLAHFQALDRAGRELALASIRQAIAAAVQRELAETRRVDEREAPHRAHIVRFIVGGYLALLIGWLEAGAKESPADIDAVFQRLVAHFVAEPPSGAGIEA